MSVTATVLEFELDLGGSSRPRDLRAAPGIAIQDGTPAARTTPDDTSEEEQGEEARVCPDPHLGRQGH